MKIREVIDHLESFAPPEYQESYDNSGLIAGSTDIVCDGVLISLDCTERVIREAAERKCNLVISHHPLIFRPTRNVIPEGDQGKALIAAIRNNITVYAAHTNLDNIISGVNAGIADKIDLQHREILSPRPGQPSVGSGIIGVLKSPMAEEQFLATLKKQFKLTVIRHSPLSGRAVSRVAVCGGAGSFLISNALQSKADFFVSADIKYHEFFSGDGSMVIADIGHYESEQFTIDLLSKVILEKFPNFAVLKSGTVTNPVHYYI